MIVVAVQRGYNVFVYGEQNRQLCMIPTGTGHSDGLVGYTSQSVSVRRGSNIFTYNANGNQIAITPAN